MNDAVSTYILETPGFAAMTVRIDRQSLPDGRICNTLISERGEVLGCWWEGGPAKQRRGSTSRYCIGSRFEELSKNQQLALLKIRRFVLNDGRIKSRRRSKESRRAELITALGSGKLLRGMRESGAIYEKDGWFYVDRRFLFRG